MWTFDKQLRHCNAWVEDITPSNPVDIIDAEYSNGVHVMHTINNGIALKSYASIVAFYDSNMNELYLMPRWDYSMTTMQQLRKFIEDYTYLPCNYTVKDIRKGNYDYMIECDSFKRIGYDRDERKY